MAPEPHSGLEFINLLVLVLGISIALITLPSWVGWIINSYKKRKLNKIKYTLARSDKHEDRTILFVNVKKSRFSKVKERVAVAPIDSSYKRYDTDCAYWTDTGELLTRDLANSLVNQHIKTEKEKERVEEYDQFLDKYGEDKKFEEKRVRVGVKDPALDPAYDDRMLNRRTL